MHVEIQYRQNRWTRATWVAGTGVLLQRKELRPNGELHIVTWMTLADFVRTQGKEKADKLVCEGLRKPN